jgi:hypothetical protein
MNHDSIFHKLVMNEDSHTQLLCNLMEQRRDFRRVFLGLILSPAFASEIDQNIRTRIEVQPNCGRPDLIIQSDRVSALVEVKIRISQGCTPNQPEGYFQALLQETRSSRWLVFLVPRGWEHVQETEGSLDRLKKVRPNAGIETKIVYWEEVLRIIEGSDPNTRDPFVEEFRKLLTERFGPLTFSTEELRMSFSGDFPLAFRAVRKMEWLVDEIRTKAENYKTAPTEKKERKHEYGVYFKNAKGDYLLWFGIWPLVCEEVGSPLCFGVDQSWVRGVRLKEAFSAAYSGETRPFDKNWIMGWVSQESLKGDDPVGRVWALMAPLLEALTKV